MNYVVWRDSGSNGSHFSGWCFFHSIRMIIQHKALNAAAIRTPRILICPKRNPTGRPVFFLGANLLLILLSLLTVTTGGGSGLLAANAAGTATTEGRGESEVDVLLGVKADHEGGNVDDLLADTDVALLDQDTGVVDGLGEAKLVHAGLETALKEILDLKGKDVIELHAGLVEDTDAHKTANQGVTLEQTLGVLLIESEQLTSEVLAHMLFPQSHYSSTYRAARRILDRVSWTRQTSRLLRRPYSPTTFSSESLEKG